MTVEYLIQKKILALYIPERSLPCSQQPATGPYSKKDECNPHCFFKINFNINYPSTPKSPKCLFSLGFPFEPLCDVHVESIGMPMFTIHLNMQFHTPSSSNGSLAIATKLKTKFRLRVAAMFLLYILQKKKDTLTKIAYSGRYITKQHIVTHIKYRWCHYRFRSS
jgi:hypothetical protein